MMPPDASELLLIRHAPADHGGRLCGRTDVPAVLGDPAVWMPLKRFATGVGPVVVSPALRCVQTALALWPDRTPDLDDRLWEQDFGDHDGLPFAEIPDLGVMAPVDLAAHRPPRGESFADVVARQRPALETVIGQARDGGPVAVVAHAGTVRAALALALDDVPAALAFEVAPWSVTRLRVHAAGVSVIATNWQPL